MKNNAFAQRIIRSWSRESAQNPEDWSPENPSRDQCAVTAALLWEELGIPIVRGQAILPDGSVESHYWNEGVDMTRTQYPVGTTFIVRDGPQGVDAYDYLLSNADTAQRIGILRSHFHAA